jgi:hypothetical protein
LEVASGDSVPAALPFDEEPVDLPHQHLEHTHVLQNERTQVRAHVAQHVERVCLDVADRLLVQIELRRVLILRPRRLDVLWRFPLVDGGRRRRRRGHSRRVRRRRGRLLGVYELHAGVGDGGEVCRLDLHTMHQDEAPASAEGCEDFVGLQMLSELGARVP